MEAYYRNDVFFNEDSLNFQSLEWLDFNESIEELEEDTYGPTNDTYIIRCFGSLKDGTSVSVNITDFTPFFYIKVPDAWRKKDINLFLDSLSDTSTLSKAGKKWYPMKRYTNSIVKKSCIIQKKCDFDGFTGEKQYSMLRLVFNNSQAHSACARLINDHNTSKTNIKGIDFKLKIYESSLPSILRFFHIRDIKPSGWINIKNFKVEQIKKSHCQIEVTARWTELNYLDNNENANFLQASFDIETFSGDLHSFPSPLNKEDAVIQIGTTFKKQNDPNFLVKHVICLKECAKIDDPDVIVECYDTEKEVLFAWKKLLIKMDPDIIYGYNSDSFDCWYIHQRAVFLKCEKTFMLGIGKLTDEYAECSVSSFSSSAYGTTEFRRMTIPGRINFDIMIFIQREYKLKKYTLNFVSESFLKENKIDLDAKEMFKIYHRGSPEDIKKIAEYCVQDTCLPQKLVDTLLIIQTQISMSNVSCVPIKYLIEKGQQIKTFSLITKFCRNLNYVVPSLFNYSTSEYKSKTTEDSDSEDDEEDEKFTGAVVLKPKKGAYFEPVCTLDFKSLYPSIMMAYNLCHSTNVKNKKFLNLPGYKYTEYEWEDLAKDDKKKTILDSDGNPVYIKHNVTYAYKKDVEGIQGVLPVILDGLVESRQNYKDLMKKAKKEGNFALANVFDKSQLAVKVTMNSVYGFLGANMLPNKKIAATVTYVGRTMIEKTKNFLEKEFSPAEVVYGDTDSCFVKFNTKLHLNYKSECNRINNLKVVTEHDTNYLNKLKTQLIAETINIGKKAAKEITEALFKYPISLEYEKVNMPCILLSKKRYIINKYEEDPEKYSQTSSGIVLNRRDNFPLVQKLYRQIMDILMNMICIDSKEKAKALDLLNGIIKQLTENTIDPEQLIIIKTYKPPKKNHNLPQLALVKKLTERDPNNAPRFNDKIPYLIEDTGSLKALPQYLKVEDPKYFKENGCKLDAEYYINYLMNPICELLEPFFEDSKKIFKDAIKEYKMKRKLDLKKV